MKTLIQNIFFVTFIVLLAQGCTSTIKSKTDNTKSSREKYGSFDKVFIPNEASVISHMIELVQPELDVNVRKKVAYDIYLAIKKYNVEPQIVVALIDTESDFKFDKISTTGDLSLGQINVPVWNIEFKRIKEPLIDPSKLVTIDQGYAMEQMAKILSILKKRHAKKDRRWYARYHSNTKRYKHDYLRKIEQRMKLLR